MLTEINHNKAAHAKESMHGVKSPFNHFLQIRGNHPNDEIEEPVRRSRQRHTLRSDGQRHDLWWVEPRNRSPTVWFIPQLTNLLPEGSRIPVTEESVVDNHASDDCAGRYWNVNCHDITCSS